MKHIISAPLSFSQPFIVMISLWGLAICGMLSTSMIVIAASVNSPTYTCTIPITRVNWDTRTHPSPDTQHDQSQNQNQHQTENLSYNSTPCLLPKFDSSTGELQHVSLTLTQTTEGEIGIENTTQQSRDITITPSTTVTFFAPDTTALPPLTVDLDMSTPTNTATPHKISLAPFDTTLDYVGTSGATLGIPSRSASSSTEFTDSAKLLTFTRIMPDMDDIYTLNAQATNTTRFSNQNGFVNFDALNTRATASVIYQYQNKSDTQEVTDNHNPASTGPEILTRSGGSDITLTHVVLIIFLALSIYGLILSWRDTTISSH